jgi:branched-chain amino acid transport system permease protein
MGASLECAVAIALQILASGFAAGAVYGLVAVGHSLVFRLTGVVHFAFGELIALGVFVTLLVAAGSGPVSQTSVGGARFLLALAAGLLVTAAASAGAYFLAIEPYRARGSVIGWVGASLAVAFAVRTLLVVFFDRPAYVFPDPLPFRSIGHDGFWRVGGATIQARSIFVAAAGLALAAVGVTLLQRTRFGRALEAIAQDFDAAVLVGLPVARLVGLAFALAGTWAGLAAILAAPSAAFDVDAAARYGLYGLLAAAVVWFEPRRALAAGLVLGLIQAAVTSAHAGGLQLGPAYRDVVPLALGLLLFALQARALTEAVE